MDPNEDPTAVHVREEGSVHDRNVASEPEGDGGGDHESSEDTEGYDVSLLLAILKGKHKWSKYLDSSKNFEDVKESLKIIYKYNPSNTGQNPAFPRAHLGDIEGMREDLMHLSALNCYLAAQAAMYESNADNIEQERKLQRSQSWTQLRRNINRGIITEKMTNDDIKHTAEVDATDLYRLEYEFRQLGRMYSWVRAAVRTFTEHLAVLIQSSMREERGDARLY